MSLDTLTKPVAASRTEAGHRTRVPTWLLPAGLLLGFVAVFALLFGSRLLPALEVRTAPVMTIRQTAEAPSKVEPSTPGEESAVPSGPLLFQASGWIEPDPYVTFVTSLVDGVVDEVFVLEGETVKKGQLLATLIDDDALLDVQQAKQKIALLESRRTAHCAIIPVHEAEQEAARKKVAAEQALLAELEDTAKRLESVGRGGVSELERTKARLAVIRQQATVAEAETLVPGLEAKIEQVHEERKAIDDEIEEARTNLARKQLALDRCRVNAPSDGVVLHLHVAPGKKRMLGMDDPKSAVIVELFNPEKLQARIDVPLSEAAGLHLGQPVKLSTDLLPDLTLLGTVTRLEGQADIQRNTLQAKVAIRNPDPRLRPEMLVRAEFYNAELARDAGSPTGPGNSRLALFAPRQALIDQSGTSASAWLAIDGKAELRQVTLGSEERDDHLLVTDGLRSGDQLILPPHDQLSPGKRIRPLP